MWPVKPSSRSHAACLSIASSVLPKARRVSVDPLAVSTRRRRLSILAMPSLRSPVDDVELAGAPPASLMLAADLISFGRGICPAHDRRHRRRLLLFDAA